MKTIPVSFKRFPALFQTYRSSLFLCSFSGSSAKGKITIKVNFQSVFRLFANMHQSAEKENSPQKMFHSLLSNVSTVCVEKRHQLRVEFTSCRSQQSMKEKTKRHFQLRFVVVVVKKDAPHRKQLLSAVPRATRRQNAPSFHHGEEFIFIHVRQIVSAPQGRRCRRRRRTG